MSHTLNLLVSFISSSKIVKLKINSKAVVEVGDRARVYVYVYNFSLIIYILVMLSHETMILWY